jgi:hypothetical protein
MPINLSKSYKNMLIISATLIAGSIIFFGVGSMITNIYAQPTLSKINITLNSTKLAQSTNDTSTRLKVVVNYITKDTSLPKSKINGILKVSALNGTLIKRSSFANGFTLNQSGIITFATTMPSKSIQSVKVDVVLTDLSKANPLSNVVTTNVNLEPIPLNSKKTSSTKAVNAVKPAI